MKTELEEISGEKFVERIKRDRDVVAVILFGSHARGRAKPISDVDLCIVLKPKKYDDSFLFNKRMKYLRLVKSDKVDVQIFQQLPVYVKVRILKEGKIIKRKDKSALYSTAFHTIKEFENFRRYYYRHLEDVLHGK